ncbi:MAG TPA: MFS transporter [bacterium]|nr:MFS transporter [bacterium]
MTYKTWTLIAAILGSSVVFLDSSVVTIALPQIGRELPTHLFGVLEGQSYVYNGYLLAESALVVLAGGLTDFYGRRRMFSIGVAGFGVASILSGLAPTMEWLVVFRLLQGVAGAFIIPGSLALITATFTGEAQGRAFGTWSGASAGLTILGPFIGGLLVDTVSWRAVFLVNVPFALLTLWMVQRFARESHDTATSGGFDIPGTILSALAIGGLVVGTISGQQREWHGPEAFVALGIGCAATALLFVRILSAANPLVPPSLFRSRNFTVTNLSTLVIYAALAVTFYYLTLFMQGTLGYTAAAAGVATIPAVVFMAVFSTRFGALASRYGPRWFMTAGPVLMAVGAASLAQVPAQSPAWAMRPGDLTTFVPPTGYYTDLLAGMVLFGLGAMMMVAPLTATLMASVPVENAGVASAINTAISDVGPQLAVALIFIAITASFYTTLATHVRGLDTSSQIVRQQIPPLNPVAPSVPEDVQKAARAASTAAFHLAMLASAALFLAGAVINAVGIQTPASPQRGRVVSPDPLWRRCRHVAPVATDRDQPISTSSQNPIQ